MTSVLQQMPLIMTARDACTTRNLAHELGTLPDGVAFVTP